VVLGWTVHNRNVVTVVALKRSISSEVQRETMKRPLRIGMAMVLMLTLIGGAAAMPAAASHADYDTGDDVVDRSDDEVVDADDNDILNIDIDNILSENNFVDNDLVDAEDGFLIFS
jgi:hypothetical protein